MSFGKKGQASIELILLLAVVLLLIQTIIMPSFEVAKSSSDDVSSMAIVRSQAQKLVNSIELVGSSAGSAKQTIHLMIPAHSKILCNDSGIILNPTPASPWAIYYQTWPDSGVGVPEACSYDADYQAPGDNTHKQRCTGMIALLLPSGTTINCGILKSTESGKVTDRQNDETAAFVNAVIEKQANEVSVTIN